MQVITIRQKTLLFSCLALNKSTSVSTWHFDSLLPVWLNVGRLMRILLDAASPHGLREDLIFNFSISLKKNTAL